MPVSKLYDILETIKLGTYAILIVYLTENNCYCTKPNNLRDLNLEKIQQMNVVCHLPSPNPDMTQQSGPGHHG